MEEEERKKESEQGIQTKKEKSKRRGGEKRERKREAEQGLSFPSVL